MGNINFGKGGEWAETRIVQVQFQNVTDGKLKTSMDSNVQLMVKSEPYASGKLIYRYEPQKSGV